MMQGSLCRHRDQLIGLTWVQAGPEDTFGRMNHAFYRSQKGWRCGVLSAVCGAEMRSAFYWPAENGSQFGCIEDAGPPHASSRCEIKLTYTSGRGLTDIQSSVTASDKLKCFAEHPHDGAGVFRRTSTRTDPAPDGK
jgi:hypothetical protein